LHIRFDDLKLKSCKKKQKVHGLTAAEKVDKVENCNRLLD
jgi:hypothetical protein